MPVDELSAHVNVLRISHIFLNVLYNYNITTKRISVKIELLAQMSKLDFNNFVAERINQKRDVLDFSGYTFFSTYSFLSLSPLTLCSMLSHFVDHF